MNEPAALELIRQYVPAGSPLAFDIGSHLGDFSRVLVQLVGRVIALEPQSGLTPPIDRVTQLWAACSSVDGTAPMLMAPDHPYLSTLAVDYPDKVRQHSSDYVFDTEPVDVPTLTLDTLAERFGVPTFVKIDVEGHELSVLEGMSFAPAGVSFEVHDFDGAKGYACCERLLELAPYEFAYSRRESFVLEPWPAADGLDIFGDVYARRTD